MSNPKQDFSVTLYQIFRTAGVTLNMDQTERLRETSDKLFVAIEAAASARAIELIRKMQTAVGEGFKGIGEDMDKLETRVAVIEKLASVGKKAKAVPAVPPSMIEIDDVEK